MMDATKFLCLMTITFSELAVIQAAHWSYTGESGPQYWHRIFPQECSGKHQSPIDISPEKTIYNPDLKDFAIWYDPPKKDSKMYLRNNGHTGQVDLEGDFFVTNGGLLNIYKALQFHFHWGHKAHHGSEHLFDGQPSPIELHLVTYNQELYADIGQAIREKGGLAVLGVMYEISDEDNPALATIVEALKHVRDPEQHERTELPLMSLRDFLPQDLTRYYRYNGSLTTPGCFESVTWTVFDARQTISHRQLKEFTTLLQFKHKHGQGHKGHGNRHRRSLTKTERNMERRAEAVLDELGIRGNEYEEAILKSELLQEKMMADMPKVDAVIGVPRSSSKPELIPTLDEERAAEIDQAVDDHERENDNTNGKTGDTHHNRKELVDVEEDVYMQEVIVNNFRPVQPLNDRIVYRSFKLGDDVTTDDNQLGESHSPISPCDLPVKGNGNGASHQDLPTVAILIVTFLQFVLQITKAI